MNLRFLPEDKQESDLFFLSLEPNLKSIEQHEKGILLLSAILALGSLSSSAQKEQPP